jgi:hypothetical protein
VKHTIRVRNLLSIGPLDLALCLLRLRIGKVENIVSLHPIILKYPPHLLRFRKEIKYNMLNRLVLLAQLV